VAANERIAIVGVGHTEFARQIPKTSQRLQVEAASKAVADAGLKMSDIDGLVVMDGGSAIGNPRYHMELSEVLGLFDTPLCMTTHQGGSSAGYAIEVGRWALLNGRVKNILVVGGNSESTMAPRTARGHGATDSIALWPGHSLDYEHPYGPIMPSYYAAVARRHMFEYGSTEEQLASIPVATRYNAGLNPDAVYRKPITHEDVLSSKMISSPLHMLHCCMVNDGGVAFILTTDERARDLRQSPVYVQGHGGMETGYWTGFITNGDPRGERSLIRTHGKAAADEAFREAGVERKDIDLLTVCDNFAITPFVLIEDYGFCEKGEVGDFVGNGDRLKVGGEFPVNPHGGCLSCNHAATNFQNYVEATIQLRGQAGQRQVEGAELALATCCAGIISTHFATVLSKN
jgi:acetyl-CoA acetyltransferase